MPPSARRLLVIASGALLTLASCALSAETPAIPPIETAIKLEGATPSASQPSESQSPATTQAAQPGSSPSATSNDDDSDSEDSESSSSSATTTVYDREAELGIEDQVGNGKTVVIEEFEVNIDNLWLVIRTKSQRVLLAMLTNTESKPVTVQLNSAITSSQELFAYLYLDNGDGYFDSELDSVVYEEPGELIEEDFMYEVG